MPCIHELEKQHRMRWLALYFLRGSVFGAAMIVVSTKRATRTKIGTLAVNSAAPIRAIS